MIDVGVSGETYTRQTFCRYGAAITTVFADRREYSKCNSRYCRRSLTNSLRQNWQDYRLRSIALIGTIPDSPYQ